MATYSDDDMIGRNRKIQREQKKDKKKKGFGWGKSKKATKEEEDSSSHVSHISVDNIEDRYGLPNPAGTAGNKIPNIIEMSSAKKPLKSALSNGKASAMLSPGAAAAAGRRVSLQGFDPGTTAGFGDYGGEDPNGEYYDDDGGEYGDGYDDDDDDDYDDDDEFGNMGHITNLAKNDTISNHVDTVAAYRQLWRRYTRLRTLYDLAARYNDRRQLLMFTCPLLGLQAANAISTQFLKDPTRAQCATALSVISGIFVALQDKFKYSLISEKWDAVGQMYSMLASQAYGKMTEQELSSEDEDTIQKGRELLIDFARYCILQERNAECPTLPGWIESSIPEDDEEDI